MKTMQIPKSKIEMKDAGTDYMQDAMFKSLPIQETIKGQLTFKGEKSTGFIINLFKMQ